MTPVAFFPDIKGIINEKLAELWAAAGDKWSGLWAPIWDGWPLYWSYGVFFCVLAGCFVVGFFVQFKWARLALGVVLLVAIGWLTGRHTMHTEMKAKLDAERKKRKR